MGKDKKSLQKDEAQLARSIVSTLLRKGVKLLALDFDKTIISVHTSGYWSHGSSKLAEHVRPCFKALIRAALDSNLSICIVTHSTQPVLIHEVLAVSLPQSTVKTITVRANTKEWRAPPGNALGKEQHLSWIITYLFNHRRLIIHPQEIFLMDDDIDNVNIALEFNHRAYLVNDDVTLQKIKSFIDSTEFYKMARSRSFSTTRSRPASQMEGRSVTAVGSNTPPMGMRAVVMREKGTRGRSSQCVSLQGTVPATNVPSQCECVKKCPKHRKSAMN